MKIYVDEKGHIIFSYVYYRGNNEYAVTPGEFGVHAILRLVKFLVDWALQSSQV